MKTQLLRSRNAKMQECRSARAQKCRKMTVFCIFALLHFCFAFSILAQTDGGTFTDPRDGETYKTVIMPDGKRWMEENLRYSKGLLNYVYGYRPVTGNIAAPGTNLQKTFYCPGPGPFSTSPNATTTSQADPLLCKFEGALYPFWTAYGQNNGTANVFAVVGEQGVCPNGWHLPTDGEWTALATVLSNNFSSLQVLNAGRRDYTGVFADRGSKAYFWTSSGSGTAAVSRSFSGGTISRVASQPASDALSVRCVEGACTEGSQIVLTMVQNTSACTKEPKTNFDTIFFKDTAMTRNYNFALSPALSTGTWTYSVSYQNLPAGVSFSSAPDMSATQLTLKFAGLSDAIDGSIFTFKIAGTNPNYCRLDTQIYNIKLLKAPEDDGQVFETPVPNTISGGEAVGAIKTMTDTRDNKTYSIILMADGKWWMRENLNYQTGLTFRSASNEPFTSSTNGVPGIGSFWCPGVASATTSSLSNCNIWGALYTWEAAVSTDGIGTWTEPSASQLYTQSASGNPTSACSRGVCPPGWHVPSDKEWGDMLNAVETGTKNHNTAQGWIGTNVGAALKSSGFTSGAKQVSGFSVLAAGGRQANGSEFHFRGSSTYIWTSTGATSSTAWWRQFDFSPTTAFRNYYYRAQGFSIRCIQD